VISEQRAAMLAGALSLSPNLEHKVELVRLGRFDQAGRFAVLVSLSRPGSEIGRQ